MRKFTKIAGPALAAMVALAAVSPASAQNYYGNQYERGYHNQDRGDWRGDRGDWRGDRGQAQYLRSQIDQLQRRADSGNGRNSRYASEEVWKLRSAFNSFNRNGLTRDEARAVEYQIDRISQILDGRGRGGYDRGDYGRDRDGRGW